MNIELKILSPESLVLSKEVDLVELPGTKGRFVVLKDHAPLISSLSEGVIRYMVGSSEECVSISSGFVKVKDNVVTACVEL